MEGFSDPATGEALQKALRDAGNPEATVFLYDKVGHAFMNESPSPFESFEARQKEMGFPPYDEASAELAWGRLVEFFGKHLKAGKEEL